MKAVWRGFLALGQVMLPVKLYSATRDVRPHFVQLHEADLSPVERVIRCLVEGKEIPGDSLTRGVEVSPGKYVALSAAEIARTAGDRDKCIDLRQFTEPAAIDPIFYDKPYYLVPDTGGVRAYVLLREALIRTGKVGIVQYVFYNKEHIGVVRAMDGILTLHQLRFAGEIVPRRDVKTPSMPPAEPDEIGAAMAFLHHQSGPFFVDDYRDEHSEQLQETIARKAKGLPPVKRPQRRLKATPERDLLPVLKRSLLQGGPSAELPESDGGQAGDDNTTRAI